MPQDSEIRASKTKRQLSLREETCVTDSDCSLGSLKEVHTKLGLQVTLQQNCQPLTAASASQATGCLNTLPDVRQGDTNSLPGVLTDNKNPHKDGFTPWERATLLTPKEDISMTYAVHIYCMQGLLFNGRKSSHIYSQQCI